MAGGPSVKSNGVSNYALILEAPLVTGDRGEEGIVRGMPSRLNIKSVKTVSCPKPRKGM
jgi:hypothetical protein